MNLIYLPIDNVNDFSCYVVYDKDTIRAYYDMPQQDDKYYNYIDFFINSHYLEKQGSYRFSSYSTLPLCISKDSITTDVYYRTDFSSSLIILFIILIIVFLFLKYTIFRLFPNFWKDVI